MKYSKFKLFAIYSAMHCIASIVQAEPVQFDTDDAHVIVVRPIDAWAGNRTNDEYSLQDIQAKRASFAYINNDGKKIWGFKNEGIVPWGKTLADDAVVHKVAAGVAGLNFTFNGQNPLFVEKPSTVEPAEMPAILNAENDLFKDMVISQGNPATLPDRNANKRLGRALVGIALLGIGIDKMGAVGGANFALSSGVSDDIAHLTINGRKSLAALTAVPFDYSLYQSIDLRKATLGVDRVGQIVIAYKREKTKQAEEQALAQAIVIASGADTTEQAVEESRKKDLTIRQAIWDECVAKDRCKND